MHYAGLAAQWTYEYDDNGTPASKIHGINDLISAFDGKLYAGSYNNSESRTYLCEIEMDSGINLPSSLTQRALTWTYM